MLRQPDHLICELVKISPHGVKRRNAGIGELGQQLTVQAEHFLNQQDVVAARTVAARLPRSDRRVMHAQVVGELLLRHARVVADRS